MKNIIEFNPDVDTNAKHTRTLIVLFPQQFFVVIKYNAIPIQNSTTCITMVDETNVVKIMKDVVMLSAAKLVAQYPPTVERQFCL